MDAQLEITVGYLMRGKMRHFLESIKHHGVTWVENKGFLESYFLVRGPAEVLKIIKLNTPPTQDGE